MQKKFFSFFLLALFAVGPAIAQDKRGPSTEAERTKALAAIDDLEKNPLGPDAKEERRWLTIWLIEVPDVTVSVCTLLPDLPKGDKKDSDIIFGQMMFSAARYVILHLDKPQNKLAEYQEGVAGVLKVYRFLLAQNPKDRQPKLDDLVQRQDAGTLDAYVQEKAATACKN